MDGGRVKLVESRELRVRSPEVEKKHALNNRWNFLAGWWKTFANAVIPSEARNLALETKDLRDSSSPAAPRNDGLEGFFSILSAVGLPQTSGWVVVRFQSWSVEIWTEN